MERNDALMETPRLLIREYEMQDLDALHRLLSDPVTMSFWPAPFTREAAEQWLQRSLESYRSRGFGRWALMRKDDGRYIGDIGIVATEIDGNPENDLGYIIAADNWGQGFATEAAGRCLDYGLAHLGLGRICANMPVAHVASRKVAENIGMSHIRDFANARNRNIITHLYAREASRQEPDA